MKHNFYNLEFGGGRAFWLKWCMNRQAVFRQKKNLD
jgi:hypothetical protein